MDIIMGKKIIVTGGAGFIGSNLVDRLSRNNEVLVIDNMHTGSQKNLENAEKSGKVTFQQGDTKDIGKTRFKADFVFHIGIYSASPMYRANPHLISEVVDGMISVLEYARSNGSKVVFASTSSIYNSIDPPHREDCIPLVTDYYTEARIAAERVSELYCKLSSMTVSAVRFFSVYGWHEEAKKEYANLVTQFMWALRKGEQPIIYGDGKQRRDFIFVDDVVEILIRSSQLTGFNVVNAGTGINYDLNEMLEKLNKYMKTDAKAKYIEMPVKNYVMETLADTGRIKSLLNYTPKVSLDDGIKKLLGQ
ncbi:MAG: NAD-dependent epimerase/dehydratase family protein [Thermoplasmataceae archaeon]